MNAQDRLMEMTGHTSDLDEAIDQWQDERQTLIELFDEAEQQDELLERVKKDVNKMRKLLYGRKPMAGAPVLKPENIQALIDTLDNLMDFEHQAEAVIQDRAETIKNYKQLALFAIQS